MNPFSPYGAMPGLQTFSCHCFQPFSSSTFSPCLQSSFSPSKDFSGFESFSSSAFRHGHQSLRPAPGLCSRCHRAKWILLEALRGRGGLHHLCPAPYCDLRALDVWGPFGQKDRSCASFNSAPACIVSTRRFMEVCEYLDLQSSQNAGLHPNIKGLWTIVLGTWC